MPTKRKEVTNECVIEGYLYEKEVRDVPNRSNDPNKEGTIAGELVIEVPIEIEGESFNSLIRISFITSPKTNAGKENPVYKGINTILNKSKSLAETEGDYEEASIIRARNVEIVENMYYSDDMRFITFPRLRGSFFDTVKKSDFDPKAQFKVKMFVHNIKDEEVNIDGELTPTGNLIVTGGLLGYRDVLHQVDFTVQNKRYIDHIQKNWEQKDTVNAGGIIKFTSEKVPVTDSSSAGGFGEPVVDIQTRTTSEFVITNGSEGALERGFDDDVVRDAIRDRKERIVKEKEKAEDKQGSSSSAQGGW